MSANSPSRIAEFPDLRPSPPLPLPSRFGRYRLTHFLASGGMAQIYLAKSFGAEGFVKPLVIKRLDPKLADNPFFTELFINEAKLLVTLSHGNIVPVFDFGRLDRDLYMAMEYVQGVSLGGLLELLEAQHRTLGLELAAYVALEVCKGLDYAHRKCDPRGRPAGIVHRDIKPSNILISREGEVKIVDFGVAKLVGRLERKHRMAGTVAYMSPEQANGQTLDARTDIFSTALVLHEMISGKRVYDGGTFEETLSLARRAEIPELPAHVPPELAALVRRALARRPEDRHAAAHELEHALSTFLVVFRASRGGETRPPRSALSELMQSLPANSAADVGRGGGPSPVPFEPRPEQMEPVSSSAWDALDAAEPLRGLDALDHGEPDLALIQNAAETFHSEFFTRALQAEPAARPWSRSPRSPRFLGWSGLVLAILLSAGIALRSLREPTAPQSPDIARDAGPPADRRVPAFVRAPDTRARAPGAEATSTQARDEARDAGPPARAASRPARRARYGYLNLNSIPWSHVTLNGRRLARTTPVLQLRLAPGLHVVELHNPDQGLKRRLKLRVRAGATTWKVVELRAPKLRSGP